MEPNIIRKLDEVIVNRIAAGEVVQRPANALKEMIENAIDAKSTNIVITVKSGGMKYMQIRDNGTGIRKEDLEIVCERFTTSKLRTVDDLKSISTYGFRGEALASISHIAHLEIVTKTVKDRYAYKAHYIDGKLIDDPIPCAGNQGTQITVEDLFYNTPNRKNALQNYNEEYQRILDLVKKYSIHNSQIGFSLKKFNERADIKTPTNSSVTNNIQINYGNDIAKQLLNVTCSSDSLKFSVNAFISNLNVSLKKMNFILFINHRLVSCASLRKAIEIIYTTYLPKAGHPFVYLSLVIKPEYCDVNVSPTKDEVTFLHEQKIIETIVDNVQTTLTNTQVSRQVYIQTRLPSNLNEPAPNVDDKVAKSSVKESDKYLTRTDNEERSIKQFFTSASKPNFAIKRINKKNKIEVRLSSVLELRKEIENNCNMSMKELFAQHKFVGCIDQTRAVIQHTTKLYLCDTQKLSEELFYQFVLYHFQNFDEIAFEPALSVYDLVVVALEADHRLEYNSQTDGKKEDIADSVKNLLIEKSDMLKTYFALNIDEEGNLKSVPRLLTNYTPDFSMLPAYLLLLASEVDWLTEKECFETFARQTARFYSHISADGEGLDLQWQWVVEHVVYEALKLYFIPDNKWTINGCVTQIANLPDLYKVFERC